MTDISPFEIRMTFGVPEGVEPITRIDNGSRITIRPSHVEVNHYQIRDGFHWYAAVSGQRIRQSDGKVSRTTGRVVYKEAADMWRPGIQEAPPWVQDIVTKAHHILDGRWKVTS